jgi:hypothetical protein
MPSAGHRVSEHSHLCSIADALAWPGGRAQRRATPCPPAEDRRRSPSVIRSADLCAAEYSSSTAYELAVAESTITTRSGAPARLPLTSEGLLRRPLPAQRSVGALFDSFRVGAGREFDDAEGACLDVEDGQVGDYAGPRGPNR